MLERPVNEPFIGSARATHKARRPSCGRCCLQACHKILRMFRPAMGARQPSGLLRRLVKLRSELPQRPAAIGPQIHHVTAFEHG